MKRKISKLLAVALSIILITSICSLGSFMFNASAATTSGTCGDNLTWEYNGGGTLTVSGTGDMNDFLPVYTSSTYQFSYTTAPWWQYHNSIRNVVIKSGVTSIGDLAFRGCEYLKNISIPDSVTSIGNYAFYGCAEFNSITIPDNVKSIGKYGFSGCTKLMSINIPNCVTSIGDYAFNGCTGLTVATLGSSVKSILCGAFYDCTGLTSITIPDSVTSIGSFAFYHCTGLTRVTLGSGISSISNYTFQLCIGLKSITIPDSVTSIGEQAFRQCSGLTSISIPDSVTTIEKNAFYACTGLTSVTLGSTITEIGNGVFYYCPKLKNITIPDSVTSIKGDTFRDCHGLTSIIIPDSVTTIGYAAFCGCDELMNVYYTGNLQQRNYIEIADANDNISDAIWYYSSILNAKSATCTETGYTGDIGWTSNGEVFSYGEEIPALGHNYGWVVISPTCTERGYTAYTCSHCNDNYKDNYTYMPCGENCGFIIESNILYIYGDGEINNYKTQSSVPWYDYVDQITEIQIGSGISKIGTYAFYCLNNLETLTVKNKDLAFGKYVLNPLNKNIKIHAKIGGNIEIYCDENEIVFEDTRLIVPAPDAPNYQSHTDSSITLVPNGLYEFSLDGKNWQKSNVFTGLSKNTIYRFYQRLAETETEFASPPSAPLIIAMPDKPEILEAGYENILIKNVDGFEYCLDDMVWQDSNLFDMLIDNTEYYVYQRLKTINGEKVYQITSDFSAVATDGSITHTHTVFDWTVIKTPTCTEKGVETGFCIGCEKTQIKEIDALGHNFVNITDEQYLKNVADCMHAAVYYKSCSRCGIKSNETFESGEPIAHNHIGVVSLPTCTERGYTTYTCPYCGNSYVDDYVDVLGHNVGEWESDETAHWHICTNCNEKLDEAGHVASDCIIDVEPTSNNSGHKHTECTVCGFILTQEDVPQLTNYIPGDINGDDKVNNKDLTRLFQHLSNWDVTVNEAALDVNGDGKVNNKDLTRLFQYLSSWNVEIF